MEKKKKSCVWLWFYLYECLASVSGFQMVEMRWKKTCVIHCCVLPLVVRFHLRKTCFWLPCVMWWLCSFSQEKSGDSVREAAEGCTVHLSLLSAAPSRGAGGAWLPLNSGPGIFPHSRRGSKQNYATVSRWLPTSLSNHTCTFVTNQMFDVRRQRCGLG